MSYSLRPGIFSLALFAVIPGSFVSAATPSERHFTFVQDGYFDGATVTGAFSGADLDGNGILVHFPVPDDIPEDQVPPIETEELSSFSMHFSGNSRLEAFDLGLADLYGFVFEIDTFDIGDDPAFDPTLGSNLIEGIGTIGISYFYTSGLGPNNIVGGFVGGHIDGPGQIDDEALDTSPNLVQVMEVPEPATGAVLAVGFVLAGVRRRRLVPQRT
jgi:hypothetical protein